MDVETIASTNPQPQAETPPLEPKRRRKRHKLNATQRAAGAKASARYREKQRAKGIPTGGEMDSVLAETVFKLLLVGHFSLTADKLPHMLKRACRNGGWDMKNASLRKALSDRVKSLVSRTRTVELASGYASVEGNISDELHRDHETGSGSGGR